MKKLAVILSALALAGAVPAGAEPPYGETGFSANATIIEIGTDGSCELDCNWDGTVENGYCWRSGGVVPPDYGSWAECYDNPFVCEAYFYFTQTGYYIGQECDVYVWEDDGGLPGDVLCALIGLGPGPIAFWPDCSAHSFPLNCVTGGEHFIGFWGDWPGHQCGWFVCADEDGDPGSGCPVTKFAPGIGYPTGWGPVHLVPIFQPAALGLCETYEIPVPAKDTTWGRIKALY